MGAKDGGRGDKRRRRRMMRERRKPIVEEEEEVEDSKVEGGEGNFKKSMGKIEFN